MKNSLLIEFLRIIWKKEASYFLVFCSMCFTAIAQEYEQADTIYFADGRTNVVKIIANSRDQIEFCYPGETVLNRLDKSELIKIVFSSGRIEKIKQDDIIDAKQYLLKYKVISDNSRRIKSFSQVSHWGPVNLEVIILDSVMNLNDSYSSNSFADECRSSFLSGFKNGTHGVGKSSFRFSEERSDTVARVVIVAADENDGEIYGYIEVVKPDEKNPGIFIINGDGGDSMCSSANVIKAFYNAGRNLSKSIFTYF